MATLTVAATTGTPGLYASTNTNTANAISAVTTSGGASTIYASQQTSGSGVAALHGAGTGNGAYGVYGSAADSAGVFGTTGSGVAGVWGYGGTYGVLGTNAPVGVYGVSTGNGSTGVEGSAWDALVGISTGPGIGAGVYASSGTGGYAGYFDGATHVQGNLTVSGSLSVTGSPKSFLIDHPVDPANKYLQHACIESSEMRNIYDGMATADANGEVVVGLPEYVSALNEDFRYQLTPIGVPAERLHIKTEVQNSSFAIAGAAPGQRISWQISGKRKDAAAKANPLLVERDKPADERGYYLSPEAFGKTADEGIVSRRRPRRIPPQPVPDPAVPPTPSLP